MYSMWTFTNDDDDDDDDNDDTATAKLNWMKSHGSQN